MLQVTECEPDDPDCIRLVQITDTHIFSSTGDEFDGFDTLQSLLNVCRQIKRQVQGADLVLVTGDLADDPSPQTYLKLRRQLLALDLPTFCLPGNHDDPLLMHKHLNTENVHTSKLIRVAGWIIIMLDTFLVNSHAGRLSTGELAFLEQSLEQYRDKNILICLHHHPVSIASAWMDEMMLENPKELFAVLDRFKHTRCLIWGHIHQEFRAQRRGVQLYGSPSTCIQFKPGSDVFARDTLGPGYSVIELLHDGKTSIETCRI